MFLKNSYLSPFYDYSEPNLNWKPSVLSDSSSLNGTEKLMVIPPKGDKKLK